MSLKNFARVSRLAVFVPARHAGGFALLVLMMASLVAIQNYKPSVSGLTLRPLTQTAEKAKSPEAEKSEAVRVPTDFEIESAMTDAQRMRRWDPMIKAASDRFGVPQKWIRAVMRQETGGRTMLAEGVKIVSRVGAMGLMQLMPETYAEMRVAYRLGKDPFDPQDNIYAGAAYLSWLKSRYGLGGMFAAYNAGPGTYEAARAGRSAFPAETVNYARNVARNLGIATPAFAAEDKGVDVPRANAQFASASPAQIANYRRILLTIPMSPYNQPNDDTAGRLYVIGGAAKPAPVQSAMQPVQQAAAQPVTQQVQAIAQPVIAQTVATTAVE